MADIRLKKITVEQGQTPLIIGGGDVYIENTTASTSVLEGSIVTNGGISINASYNSTSSTSGGALTVAGGVSVMKNIFIGEDLNMDSSNGVIQVGGLSDYRLFLDTISNKNFYISPDGVNRRFELSDTTLIINITTISTSSSEGALCIKGGISIDCTENVINASNGGALTVSGGVAIGKSLDVANEILLGESNSDIPGLTIRYTGRDQIVLNNNFEEPSGSINMNGDKLIIGNESDIIFMTSSGNILFSNEITEKTMMKINQDNTQFDEPVNINNILTLNGDQIITSTSESTSVTEGGSLTIYGGMSVNKNIFVGESIGLDNLNEDKRNKLIIYQADNDLSETTLFSGIGSGPMGSMSYQVSSSSGSHIFYSGLDEVFRIRGNNEIVFAGKDQSYTVLGGGVNDKALSYQSMTDDSSINFFTHDGLNQTKNDICIFGMGLPNGVDNEYLKLGWDSNNYVIEVNNSGSGVVQNLVIQSNIVVGGDGTTRFNSNIISENSSTGSLVIEGGGLSINTTENAISITSGGCLTIAGGSSVAKDMLVGGDFTLSAGKPSFIKFSTINGSNSLQIQSDENNNPAMDLMNNSSIEHPVTISLYSLGSSDAENYQNLQISTTPDLSGYTIQTNKYGNGMDKYISIFTGTTNDQFVLQTSGNVGIGIHDPEYTFDINGNLHCNNDVIFTSITESINSTTGAFVINGGMSINCIDDAESLTKGGALTIAGGACIGGQTFIGGVTQFKNETPSTSVEEAAVIISGGLSIKSGQNSVNTLNGGGLTVAGGAAITGDLYVGGSINGSGSSSSTYAYLTLTATDDAVNLSTGTLVSLGGITLQSDTNAVNISNGGTILTPGGASIGKDVYIGGNVFMTKGITNYYSETDNNINFYDDFNILRFSIDKSTSTQNFSITRHNGGPSLEKTIEIVNSNGKTIFNNTKPSNSISDASVVFNGGVSIQTTTNASSIENGGSLTIGGGISISKNTFIGGDIRCLSTTESNNVSTGALLISGGIGVSGNLNVLGDTLIVGNLTVNGQTSTIESVNTTIKDNVFVLNSGPSGSKDSGFVIERYQLENNSGLGDVVADDQSAQFTLPDQSGMTSIQVNLGSNANAINDYYNGWWIKIATGFSSNQVRKVVGYNGTTRIATLSESFLNQNPSIGDVINLYNKPYVGIIFNEVGNRFEFGSTVQDPQSSNVSFTDHLPIVFSNATSVSTEVSSNVSTGSVQIAGGISISNTTNANSVTSGGTFTTLGGASIGKNLYVGNNLYVNGANLTPNPYDMFTTQTHNGNNNTSSFTNLTGLVFDNSVWGFDCYISVRVAASSNLYTNFHVRGVNKSSSWEIIKTYVGDDTGIEFNITEYGQIQYTTPNYDGFTSLVFKWRAFVN
jgi:hypothetical protein